VKRHQWQMCVTRSKLAITTFESSKSS